MCCSLLFCINSLATISQWLMCSNVRYTENSVASIYIIDVCSSFSARDCNACFSQIFKKRTCGYLNEEEESLFMTLSSLYSFSSSCLNFVTLNSSIRLTVVTAYGLNQLGLANNMWPLFITEMHTNPGNLNCANCDTQTTEPVLRNHAIRKTLLHGCDDKFILLVSWINGLQVIVFFLQIHCCKFGCCCFNHYWWCFSNKLHKFINTHV